MKPPEKEPPRSFSGGFLAIFCALAQSDIFSVKMRDTLVETRARYDIKSFTPYRVSRLTLVKSRSRREYRKSEKDLYRCVVL